MQGLRLTEEIMRKRELLEDTVKQMKQEGKSEEKIIHWIFREYKEDVTFLYNSHFSLSNIIEISYSMFPDLWMID